MSEMEGKRIAVTGTFPQYSRAELTRLIEAYGGIVSNSVSRRTDYLIYASNGTRTSKYKNATAYRVKRITLDKWLKLANSYKETMITPYVKKLVNDPNVLLARVKELAKLLPLTDGVGWSFEENYKGYGFSRGWFYDGSGSEDNVIVYKDDNNTYVLLYTYDSESNLNTYGANPPQEQIVFKGIPEPLKTIIDGPSLHWDWDEIDPKITYATSAAWFSKRTGAWEYNYEAYADTTGGFEFAADIWLARNDNEWAEWLKSYIAG